MTHWLSKLTLSALLVSAAACATPDTETDTTYIGSIDRRISAIDQIVAPDARIKVLASGFTWPEGPVWVEAESAVYFNDVPEN